ncbi:MAG: hypothetical protein ACOC87_00925 [Candidatus Natronoplasma sp.]
MINISSTKTNRTAGIIAVLGGVLMIIAGVTGASTWAELGEIAIDITGIQSLGMVFQVLVLIGSLGGLVVILGGLILQKSVTSGKILIAIGAGFGIIGLIIFLIVTFMGDNPVTTFISAIGLGFIGLILSIVARIKAV